MMSFSGEKPVSEDIDSILHQLKNLSKNGKINFAFAFMMPDSQGNQWFQAYTGGTCDLLKQLFTHDTNAEAVVRLNLKDVHSKDPIWLSLPPFQVS